MSTVFELPVIYKREKSESIRVMIETLSKLEAISNQIFNNIESKIDDHHKTVKNIQERVEKSKKMVDSLKKRKKATTVFSPSVLQQNLEKENKPLFSDVNIEDLGFKPHKIANQPESFSPHNKINDPEFFFRNKIKNKNQLQKMKRRRKTRQQLEEEYFMKHFSKMGLGKVPNNLSTVSSLLVFNSNSNCYYHYNSEFDPLRGEILKDDKDSEIETGIEDPAPPSLLGEGRIFEYENITIGFKPQTRKLKKFEEVELGLSNVADVGWKIDDDEFSILPSSKEAKLKPLEEIQEEEKLKTGAESGSDNVDEPDTDDMPAPPPMDDEEFEGLSVDDDDDMPAPPEISEFDEEQKKKGSKEAPEMDLPPSKQRGVPIFPDMSAPDPGEGGGGGRSDFLAEIRNFKKNKLKDSKDRTLPKIKVGQKKRKPVQKSMHQMLMEQLRNKLNRRRTAMEGRDTKKESSNQKSGFEIEEEESIKRPSLKKVSSEGDKEGDKKEGEKKDGDVKKKEKKRGDKSEKNEDDWSSEGEDEDDESGEDEWEEDE